MFLAFQTSILSVEFLKICISIIRLIGILRFSPPNDCCKFNCEFWLIESELANPLASARWTPLWYSDKWLLWISVPKTLRQRNLLSYLNLVIEFYHHFLIHKNVDFKLQVWKRLQVLNSSLWLNKTFLKWNTPKWDLYKFVILGLTIFMVLLCRKGICSCWIFTEYYSSKRNLKVDECCLQSTNTILIDS